MQFMREATAVALGMPERSNWRACAMPREGEDAVVKQVKRRFKPFDFTAAE